jgi:hypothetical protein
MLDKTIKEAYLIDAAIPNSHNLYSTITEKLQKYAELKEELTGIWQLNAVYPIRVIKSRRMRWGHVARMGDRRGAYGILVGRPEGKRPLRRPRPRWDDNIKMDLEEVGWCGMDWIDLAQDRDRWRAVVIAVMNLWAP